MRRKREETCRKHRSREAVSDFGILRSGKSGGFRWRWRLRTVKTRLTLACRGGQAYIAAGSESIMEIPVEIETEKEACMAKEETEHKPEDVIAGAILTAAEIIGQSRRGDLGGGRGGPIARIKVSCGGRADIISTETREGSDWWVSKSSQAAAQTEAKNKAEANAKTAAQNDLRDQYDQIECEAGCTKNKLPDPIPTTITSGPTLLAPTSTLGVTTEHATATAQCKFTVLCT